MYNKAETFSWLFFERKAKKGHVLDSHRDFSLVQRNNIRDSWNDSPNPPNYDQYSFTLQNFFKILKNVFSNFSEVAIFKNVPLQKVTSNQVNQNQRQI